MAHGIDHVRSVKVAAIKKTILFVNYFVLLVYYERVMRFEG